MKIIHDQWLSGIFGHDVVKLSDISGSTQESFRSELQAVAGCRRLFAYSRVPACSVRDLGEMTKAGFSVVDVSLTFERLPASDIPAPAAGIVVRQPQPDIHGAIVDIAGTCFRFSRFHLDPQISSDVAARVKREWVSNSLLGKRGCGCYVALKECRVAGFLTVVESDVEGVSCRIIDLVGVKQEFHRGGVGRALVNSFVRESCGRAGIVRVGTQAANKASIRLYEECGFRFLGAEYVLHAHLNSMAES